jgi:hypothetical protein
MKNYFVISIIPGSVVIWLFLNFAKCQKRLLPTAGLYAGWELEFCLPITAAD